MGGGVLYVQVYTARTRRCAPTRRALRRRGVSVFGTSGKDRKLREAPRHHFLSGVCD